MYASWDGKQYVCFVKETGELYSVGPSIEDGYEYIEVTEKEIAPIQSYEDKMEDYRVLFDITTKTYKLKKNISINDKFVFNKLLHISDDNLHDLVFTVDKQYNLCYINTNQSLIDSKLEEEILFSVTKKDDPHFLYKTIKFNLSDTQHVELNVPDEYSIYSDSKITRCVYEEKK